MPGSFSKDDLIEILRLRDQEDLSQEKIASLLNCSRSTVRDFLIGRTYKNFWDKLNKKPIVKGNIEPTESNSNDYEVDKMYIITSAQNNTYIHKNFLKAIQTFSAYNNAEIKVASFLYDARKDDIWFDPKVRDYLTSRRERIAYDLTLCAELNVRPTAVNPCTGLQSYGADHDIIVPHSKQEALSVPTNKSLSAKVIFTTGCVTQRNYIQMKEGQKAEAFHKYGALVVEVDKQGISHTRQIECTDDTGAFYDLDKYYTPEGVKENQSVEAINWGDLHAAKLDQTVAYLSWRAENSILDRLKPKFQFVHDVFDMEARNNHQYKQQAYRLAMRGRQNEGLVKEEVELTCVVMKELERDFSKVVIVESNHNQALVRWLDQADYRLDDDNATYFLELQLARYRYIESLAAQGKIKEFPAFQYACKKVGSFNFNSYLFLEEDDPFIICGDIDCGQHGHLGNNGARGSVNAYSVRNLRYNIGHVHAPSIHGHVFAAGVSGLLDMGYNRGGSAWAHAHIITYPNGARTLIFIKDGRYTK